MKPSSPDENPSELSDERARRRLRAKRAALNALRRARRAAERGGVPLSEWEGEFLGSVESRVGAFGRAFGDPDKGAPGAALSLRQGMKLKEITAKARGGTAKSRAAGAKPRGLRGRHRPTRAGVADEI